jgi:hypothetical protein
VENSTVFHYSTHAVVLNYRMEAGSLSAYAARIIHRSDSCFSKVFYLLMCCTLLLLALLGYNWTDVSLYHLEKLYSESLKLSKIDLGSSLTTITKRKRFTLYRCNSSLLI